jgi:3-oxoacyl-[acyl-carrier protein] reductase
MRLKGKTALVAGAGRNNGKAIALEFAREGADLVLVAKSRGEELNEVARACTGMGVNVLPLLADVSDQGQVDRIVAQGLERFGCIDVLMSVAGLRPHKPVWEFGYDEWLQVFATNLHSTFYLAKALAPGMMERKSGSIVAVGGLGALMPTPENSVGLASKHGLYGLIKSLALELGPYGIRANLVNPGFIDNQRLNPEWYPKTGGDPFTSKEFELLALKRKGTAQDVANVAVFLASNESSYVTGDRINCLGGRYM